MSTTHHSALALIPPEDLWGPIQAIRRRHDRQFRRWMPHINLLYPFRARGEFEAAARALQPPCADVLPFEIRLERIDWFHHGHGSYTLWLAPEPKAAVVELQARLAAALPDCDDSARHAGGFTPHLSIGQVSGREALERLRLELQAQWRPLAFIAREICLIARDAPPQDVFGIDRRLRLGPR